MSLPLPAPRPTRSNKPAPPPFRVVLPDLDLLPADSHESATGASALVKPRRLAIAEISEVDAPPQSLSVLLPAPIDDEGNPRGLVILEQVLGQRDVQGRPITFARKLRHRLFAFALGLTIVSAAALVVGLVGDIDSALQSQSDEVEPLGSSAVSLGDDLGPQAMLGAADEDRADGRPTDRETLEDAEGDDPESAESNRRPPAWLKGVIMDDEESAASPGEQP